MGYDTSFLGFLKTDKPLSDKTYKKIIKLQDKDYYYFEKQAMPDTRLSWEIQADRQTFEWDGSEKFYSYIEWIEYIIKEVLSPAGYFLSGNIIWQGANMLDIGQIKVVRNKIILIRLVNDENFNLSLDEIEILSK